MDPAPVDDEVVLYELPPMCRVYRSGRVERLVFDDVAPAGVDPSTGVSSKDITIDAATGLAARLYLPSPSPETKKKKLPVLVYFHGGGFIVGTPYSPTYHTYLNSLSSLAGVLAVSVHYRRSPEHLLPAAYDDSWAVLKWVAGAAADEWLVEHGDVEGGVFLAGDSAGGNISHHMAMRAGEEVGGGGVPRIEGILLMHPYFVTPAEAAAWPSELKLFIERLWTLVRPPATASGGDLFDDPWINPLTAAAAPGMEKMACRRVLVAVAGLDVLKGAGKAYYERLMKGIGGGGAVEAELVESGGENHIFHLLTPGGSDKAAELMDRVVAFLLRSPTPEA